MSRSDATPILAGVVAAIVGFASSFAIVLAGLRAVGANPVQAQSGLLVLSVAIGLTGIWLCWRSRIPASVAWSTPGAALLIGAGAVHSGYAAALGAFAFAGLLTVLAGLSRTFERAIASIPPGISSALLAGVLLPICLTPARAAVSLPALAGPVILTWLVLARFARRTAVAGALLSAIAALAIDGRLGRGTFTHVLPAVTATAPGIDVRAIVGLGLPLFLVTMASQNLAGIRVLSLHGYRPSLRPILTTTGAVSALVAPLGGHAINLAAITAGMMAGPEAGARADRRWIAGAAFGVTCVLLGGAAGPASGLVARSPALLVDTIAGLALLGALGSALSAALADPADREAVLITFLVTASGISALGLNGPVWGLAAGLLARIVRAPMRFDAENRLTG